MRKPLRAFAFCLAAVAACGVALPIWAQGKTGKPAGGGEAAEDDSPPAKSSKPGARAGGKGKAADKETASPKSGPVPAVKTEDPAIAAILAMQASTPAEWVRLAAILNDLQRPELARPYLAKVLEAKPDANQLCALGEQFGSALFIKLAGRPELAPEARQLGDAVLEARAAQVRDPARLDGLVKQLQDPSPEKRYRALLGIQDARGYAVAPLLAALGDPKRAAEHPNIREALNQLGSDAVRPLVAMIDAADARPAAAAAGVLADLNARSAIPYLLGAALDGARPAEVRDASAAALRKLHGGVPDRREAADYLALEARRYFDRLQRHSADSQGRVEMWFWDAAGKQPAPQMILPDAVSLFLAARFARDACALAPQDEEIRLLHLATMLESASWQNGLDQPLSVAKDTPGGQAAASGLDRVERVLVFGMEQNHPVAALAAARVLGQMEKAAGLLYRGPQPAPLVLASRHPDRRLRAAAVEAVMRLQPPEPYPGATFILEGLQFLAAGSGRPRALVGGPSLEESRRIGGYLARLGYESDVAATGREVLRLALESPDYEMILLDPAIDHPTVDFLVQHLRRDGRSAGLPIGVLARDQHIDRAQRAVADDPLAEAFPRPQDEEMVRWQVARLLDRAGWQRAPAVERQRQAALALDWLARLGTDPEQRRFYDLARVEAAVLKALRAPALSAKATAVLAMLGTPGSQRALADAASLPAAPIEVRRAAVSALLQSTQRYGILLTTGQIRQQYDRYNQSATQDTATQQVLGQVLDLLEAPTQAGRPAHPAANPGGTLPSHEPKPVSPPNERAGAAHAEPDRLRAGDAGSLPPHAPGGFVERLGAVAR
jgi:DNA-binding response OmpR family regulator